MRRLLAALILLGSFTGCRPKPPTVDPAEVKLRDTTIAALRTFVERAKHPKDRFERGDSVSSARAACDKPSLDRMMNNEKLKQEILAECAKDMPIIEELAKGAI